MEDYEIIDKLMNELKSKLDKIALKSQNVPDKLSLNFEILDETDSKIKVISQSIAKVNGEYPFFSKYLSYLKEAYDRILKDSIAKEKTKFDKLQNNLKSLKSQLDMEVVSKSQTVRDLKQEKVKNEELETKLKSIKEEYIIYKQKFENIEQEIVNLTKENKNLKDEIANEKDKTKEFIEKLDLENYDLRSDDFFKSIEAISKPNDSAYPAIPKLNLVKVYKWKQEVNNESESAEEEEEEEEDLLTENQKHMPTGSHLDSSNSMTRKGSLLRRKEEVIDMLNKAYENEESKQIESATSKNLESSDRGDDSKVLFPESEDEVNMKSIRNDPAKELPFKKNSKAKKKV